MEEKLKTPEKVEGEDPAYHWSVHEKFWAQFFRVVFERVEQHCGDPGMNMNLHKLPIMSQSKKISQDVHIS